jgi:hypothetical protein
MIFTRFGLFVIGSVVAVIGAAIAFGVWSIVRSDSTDPAVLAPTSVTTSVSSESATPTLTPRSPTPLPVQTAADGLPIMDFARVINFVRYGAVSSIEVDSDNNITVQFRDDWIPTGLGTTSHTYHSSLPAGQSVSATLQAAGIKVGADGVTVVQH